MATQCEVEQLTFGDQQTPSMGFQLTEAPEKAGEYVTTDAYGRTLKLEVVQSVSLNLRKNQPGTFAEGDEGYLLIGWLRGDAGRAPVQMVTLHKPSLSPGEPNLHVALVLSVLSDMDVQQASQAQRVAAGPRVVNSITGKSVPLSSAARCMSLYGFPSDLSTLFGEEVPADELHADKDCIEIAYKRYNLAQRIAEKSMAECVAIVMAGFVSCMALANLALLTGPAAPITFTLAVAACLSGQVLAMLACLSAYNNSQLLNAGNLQLDLEACGVHFAHM